MLTACVVIAQTGAGVSGLRPAAAVECQGVGSQLRFMRPAERQASGRLPSGSMEDADGSAAVPRIPLAIVFDAELRALVTSCCVETLWPLPGAVADLQKALTPARRAPATPLRLRAADRWKSAARSATLQGAPDEAPPEVPAATESPGPGPEGGLAAAGMQRASSARAPGLSIDPALVCGPSSDAGDALGSAVASTQETDEDMLMRERIAMSSQASTPASATAAQAAREAWASSFRSTAHIEQGAERLGRRRSMSSSRTSGVACSPPHGSLDFKGPYVKCLLSERTVLLWLAGCRGRPAQPGPETVSQHLCWRQCRAPHGAPVGQQSSERSPERGCRRGPEPKGAPITSLSAPLKLLCSGNGLVLVQ